MTGPNPPASRPYDPDGSDRDTSAPALPPQFDVWGRPPGQAPMGQPPAPEPADAPTSPDSYPPEEPGGYAPEASRSYEPEDRSYAPEAPGSYASEAGSSGSYASEAGSYAPEDPVSFAAPPGAAPPPAYIPPQPMYAPPTPYETPSYGAPDMHDYGAPNFGIGTRNLDATYAPSDHDAAPYEQPTQVPPPGDPVEWATDRPPVWGTAYDPTEPGARDEGSDLDEPPARRNGTARKILLGALTFVLVAVLAVVAKGGLTGFLDRLGEESAAYPTVAPPTGVSATSTASAPPTSPYEDTPASQYPEAEAGITLPAGTAVAGFTAEQVTARLQQVKQAVIAARLDPKMVVDRDPSTLLSLLSPESNKEIKPYFDKKDFFGFATQVAPGYSLTADKVRVSGRVTFRASTENGVRLLEVITNFVWVYPFTGGLEQPGDHLVIVHDEVKWNIPVDADVDKNYRGLRIAGWDGFASNMDCDLLKESLIGLGKPKYVPGAGSQEDDSAFDPSRSLAVTSTC